MMDDLGDRMKSYEAACSHVLPPRMPVIVRVDGRAFHSVLRKATKPFDDSVTDTMQAVMAALFREASNSSYAYQQSDEISILLIPYKKFTSQPWFGGTIEKITSIAASIAGVEFSTRYPRRGYFDARCFVMPEADVPNYFRWRQADAVRNSISAHARYLLGYKATHGKSTTDMVQMCEERGSPWSAVAARHRLGSVVYRRGVDKPVVMDAPSFKGDVGTILDQFEDIER